MLGSNEIIKHKEEKKKRGKRGGQRQRIGRALIPEHQSFPFAADSGQWSHNAIFSIGSILLACNMTDTWSL